MSASTVYTTEDIKLRDGTEVTLAPLSITRLRKFMKRFEDMGKLDDVKDEDREDAIFDILIDLGILGLEGCNVDLPEKREDKEDKLDVPTVHRIIKVCGGIDLQDPKLPAGMTDPEEIPGLT